jgi:hypothetical protein
MQWMICRRAKDRVNPNEHKTDNNESRESTEQRRAFGHFSQYLTPRGLSAAKARSKIDSKQGRFNERSKKYEWQNVTYSKREEGYLSR